MQLYGISFGIENSKLGQVMSFSLPSGLTCPGASLWCKKHCYAKRYGRLRPNYRSAYARNLEIASKSEEFTETMIGVLPRILPCFRIHVSGDYYSKAYIQCWKQICEAFPQTQFWCYTRSWMAPELSESLADLRGFSNMHLIASTDPSTSLPPRGWRVAFLDSDPRAEGYRCHEDGSQKTSCLSCGYCFRSQEGNVILPVR